MYELALERYLAKSMISVIIPVLNEAATFDRTLRSIFDQTVNDIEVIVINDGSTDNLETVLQPWFEKIQYISFEKNKGRQIARNTGIAASRGEYIFVCDADIVMRPDCLEKMLHTLQTNPRAAYAYSSYTWAGKRYTSFPFDAKRLREMNYINMASLVRREAHPGFDEAIGRFQEWDVWLSILEKGGEGVFIPEYLFSFGPPRKEGLSTLLPAFMYRIPWKKFSIRIRTVEQFEYWKSFVQRKHGI